MNKTVGIIDYGAGNILSVRRAFEYLDATPRLISLADDISSCDFLVLPGVGAFQKGMEGLEKNGLVEPIKAFARSGKPLLGICLGAQMLAEEGLEFGRRQGLGLIRGIVTPVSSVGKDGSKHKLPAIGWANLYEADVGRFADTPLSALDEDESVYLVHSFHIQTKEAQDTLAYYDYNGLQITAAVRNGCVFGFQFHPEKSGETGLKLLRSFLEI